MDVTIDLFIFCCCLCSLCCWERKKERERFYTECQRSSTHVHL